MPSLPVGVHVLVVCHKRGSDLGVGEVMRKYSEQLSLSQDLGGGVPVVLSAKGDRAATGLMSCCHVKHGQGYVHNALRECNGTAWQHSWCEGTTIP